MLALEAAGLQDGFNTQNNEFNVNKVIIKPTPLSIYTLYSNTTYLLFIHQPMPPECDAKPPVAEPLTMFDFSPRLSSPSSNSSSSASSDSSITLCSSSWDAFIVQVRQAPGKKSQHGATAGPLGHTQAVIL